MWGCVIGLQRETPPLKKKKKKKKKTSVRGDPHLASRLAPAQPEGTGAAARAASVLPFPFSLRFPPPSREEKTNKEEQIAGRRSASRTFPPRIQVTASILSGGGSGAAQRSQLRPEEQETELGAMPR